MRFLFTFCTASLVALFTVTALRAQDVPFHKGVNLTNWFQAESARQVQFTRYTRQDFEQIQRLGCDVIRLPINLHYMTSGAPDYTVDPLFYTFLDQVVDWSEELNLHLILDNHTFDPAANTDPNVGAVLKKVWTQVAAHYQDSEAHLYYEVLNEPHGIADATWNMIQQEVVATIRTVDTTHTIIVGPAEWNSFHNLDEMPVYEDDNLIYTFHFYDPFLFTHQGATWGSPSMVDLTGMPFPYDADRMPPLPASLRGTWVEGAYGNYAQDATVAQVKSLLDLVVQFRTERQVPVFCGEFGVYIPNSPPADRVLWYDTVRSYLEAQGIAWTIWDYHGGFGLFEPGGNDLFDHDLNVPLLEALGLTVPPQTPYEAQPDTVGFMIYSDYLGSSIVASNYSEGPIDYYTAEQPNYGAYSLSWTGALQYNAIGFDFSPNKDLSQLVEEGYALDFLFRSTDPDVKVDLRFLDTKTDDPNDHPWRMNLTLDTSRAAADLRWHHVRIPLSQFTEQGAWDNNQWYNPDGKFDWAAIDRFEIVSEQGALGDAKLWFDQVQINNQDTTQVLDTTALVTSVRQLAGNLPLRFYPNPAQDHLTLVSTQPGLQAVELRDPLGRLVWRTSFHDRAEIDLSRWTPGVYFLHVQHENGQYQTGRIVKR
ncbi:endoglucanase [Catalinimonas alkaloidigena]|uniref:Endoglucanase n=1 Tax=Catalinimonas alkaloidigena TaxID=1075417 RepID=A0A1G9LS29_9BACT|nr:cellulase family glycosylhydrolase [Catalinimonas alkaloidigena]SDL64780.1 endoglucanase [Catalinimonas alkaloidigena]